jgi:hypothetical protein
MDPLEPWGGSRGRPKYLLHPFGPCLIKWCKQFFDISNHIQVIQRSILDLCTFGPPWGSNGWSHKVDCMGPFVQKAEGNMPANFEWNRTGGFWFTFRTSEPLDPPGALGGLERSTKTTRCTHLDHAESNGENGFWISLTVSEFWRWRTPDRQTDRQTDKTKPIALASLELTKK